MMRMQRGVLASADLESLRALLAEHGAKPVHATRILKAWLRGLPIAPGGGPRDAPFPRALLEFLPELQARLDGLLVPVSEHAGGDGSLRTLLRLEDGLTVESVLLLRDGLCVSTQVGCAVGCGFCWTGREGLQRNLAAEEILAQVALARRRRRVRRVVFMGMGEPSHNLAAVLETCSALGSEGGLAHKLLVVSTVGDRKLFDRMLENPVRPALALSLHTTDPELRARLLPRAPRIPPEELVELAEGYARRTTWPVQYQWTLLAGVNDGDEEVERLAALMQGKYGVVNFIPYNEVEGLEYARPSVERARAMVHALARRGVLAKIRRSAGQDVEGACGQLRARSLT